MAAPANPIHFGTDGWRAIIADEFTFANVRRVASAAASYFAAHPNTGNGHVYIGYDRRFLSRDFAECAARVMRAKGVKVLLASTPVPTPAVSFSIAHHKASWGIQITASHNPALYNGFKIKEGLGRSAPPSVTEEIQSLAQSSEMLPTVSDAPLSAFDDRVAYTRYLKSRLDWKLMSSYAKTVVFDHLYGVGAGIPEKVLSGTKIRSVSLHAEVDPLFGGLHPEPIESQLSALQAEVKRRRAAVGIALDGDADRLGVVDEKGVYLTPHQVFPMLVLHCIENKGWRGKIVQAVSLGYLSERIANAFGLPFEEVPVGFKHVAERMLGDDFLAGGEESGGYAVRGGLPERDGILNGLLFIEMLAAVKRTPSEYLKRIEKRFGRACFKRIDIPLEHPIRDRTAFLQKTSSRIPDELNREKVKEVRTRDGVKIVMASGSWVLLRPSGTEPLIRTYAESDTPKKTDQLLNWAQKVACSS